MTATAPMTPAQGKFLTALLDQATARDAEAGALFRTSARQAYEAGNLGKREASAWIDALKKWVGAVHPAPAANVVRSTTSMALRGPAPRGVQTHGAPAVRPAHAEPVVPQGGALDPQAEMRMLLARREAASTLRKGPAKAKGGSRRTGPSVMDSLRSWTPERARLANEAHARGETPF